MNCNHEWYQGKCVHCEAAPNIAKENAELRAEIDCEENRFAVLQDQLADVCKERDELRAQLSEHEKDAEILRCAKQQARLVDVKGGNTAFLNYQNACIKTCDAVRAREEAVRERNGSE